MKHLILITGTYATEEALKNQLYDIFSQEIYVESYSGDNDVIPFFKERTILFSSQSLKNQFRTQYDESCTILVAARNVNFEYIDRLYNIPAGEDVLYVNDSLESSLEGISTLQSLGIEHLHYYPFDHKAKTPSSITIAITPGEKKFVPTNIPKVINLGVRLLDLTTIINIAKIFKFTDHVLVSLTNRYLSKIIELSKGMASMHEKTNRLNDSLQKVVNSVNEGILSFKDNGEITVFNESLKKWLRLYGTDPIGKQLTSVIKNHDLLYFLRASQEAELHFMNIHDQEYSVYRFYLERDGITVATFRNTEEQRVLEKNRQVEFQKKGYIAKYSFANILGTSPKLLEVKQLANKLADSHLPFFIQGESGTGKELFASAIHSASSRKNNPYLAINCSALPEDLLESELFGYEEGSFTGARKGGKKGVFEQADGGTLFLDEIGDISLKLQARLLRVLQEYEIRRIGGDKNITINVRLITATNKNLIEKIDKGEFREDLYYRLKVLYIELPPLRERKEDIPTLIKHFVQSLSPKKSISHELLQLLSGFQWKGNIRELQNAISYMVTISGGDELSIHHLPPVYHHSKPILLDTQLKDCLHVLYKIEQQYGNSSRSKLMEHFPNYSEQQIRTILSKLQKDGYVQMNKGRGGTILTSKGIMEVKSTIE